MPNSNKSLVGHLSRRSSILAIMTGLIAPLYARLSWAFSPRPSEAFMAEELDDALRVLFGGNTITMSDQITVAAAELAENGAVVPVKVKTNLDDVKSISLLASKNPIPLVAQFDFAANVKPFIATRIKLAESSEIIAVVETNNGVFQSRKWVEVTIGGCGA